MQSKANRLQCFFAIVVTLGIGARVAWAATDGVTSASRPAGMIGWWGFDKFRGAIALDRSGLSNDALVRSGRLVRGVWGAGLACDGRRTTVRCAAASGINPTKALTIEAWVRLASNRYTGHPPIVRKEGAFALRFGEGKLGLALWIGGKISYVFSKRRDWPTDRWMHVAATYDGKRMRLFADGREVSGSPRPQVGAIDSSTADVYIGSSAGGSGLHGAIDEVRLFDGAAGAAQVRSAWAAGKENLKAQAKRPFQPREIGSADALAVFRKPKREIRMVADGYLWIDAEDFDDYGGWWIDTQFVHLMGSAQLIAAGVGTPVKDATCDLPVPTAGTYRVWVRARNWLADHAPGRFQLLVGGKPLGPTFGQATKTEWLWQDAGTVELAKGNVKLALHDLTGYYGRCDAIVLTTDLKYAPPSGVAAIRAERARLTGLSLKPKPVGEYDVIVVGAGAAGCCAAIASARTGAKTALIQNRPVLGGNASIECGVGVAGAGSLHRNARESGIIEECGRVKARYGYPKMSEPFRIVTAAEKDLTVFLNRHVFAAEMRDDKTIAAVKAVDTLTGEITSYRAKVFLDCTGDGWVGFFAGAKFARGREARAKYNESLAPAKADDITMSGCIMGRRAVSYAAKYVGEPTAYVPPKWAPKFPPIDQFGRRPRGIGGQWWLEHAGTIDDIYQAERARDELIRISFGYWDWIKNVSPMRDRAARYRLAYVPITDAKRESRRLIGDYVLTQNDVQAGRVFADRISYGGWPIDVHHPEGIFSGRKGPFHCNPRVPIYTIPFRCLYSANVDNLLFAGRCMSVTHIALGTVRVQGTLAATGQAAGTAAALCTQMNLTPRALGRRHIRRLQQTLVKHDQYIPAIGNDDPGDLARRATITASSTAEHDEFDRTRFRPLRRDGRHELNMPRAMMFPRGRHKRIKTIFCLLTNRSDKPATVTLHLRTADKPADFTNTKDLTVSTATIAPRKKTWLPFTVNTATDSPYLWAWLDKNADLSWERMADAPPSSSRAYGGDGRWTPVPGQYYALHTDPPTSVPSQYAAKNITNGITRIVGRTPNLWSSDPKHPMPQWLQLDLPTPARANTAYLTFDTDMNAPFHTVPLVPQCVRDYTLTYHDGKTWRPLDAVRGNFQRRRVHRFPTISARRFRLTIQATNGTPAARVFEVRLCEE